MRFHLSMMLVVIFVAMTMHAMASAATPIAADPVRTERYNAAVHEAGETLNTHLNACKEQAAQEPKASKRDLIACQRAARKTFRTDIKQARAAK